MQHSLDGSVFINTMRINAAEGYLFSVRVPNFRFGSKADVTLSSCSFLLSWRRLLRQARC